MYQGDSPVEISKPHLSTRSGSSCNRVATIHGLPLPPKLIMAIYPSVEAVSSVSLSTTQRVQRSGHPPNTWCPSLRMDPNVVVNLYRLVLFCQWGSQDTYPVAINICKPKTINSHGCVGGSTVVPEVDSAVIVHKDVVGFSVTIAFAVSFQTQRRW